MRMEFLTYPIISVAVFTVAALIALTTNKVTNQMSVALIALFPLAALLLPGAPENLLYQIIAMLIAYVVGMIVFVKLGGGGGVGRAMAIIALWVPIASLWNVLTLALILGGVWGVVELVVLRSDPDKKSVPLAGLLFASLVFSHLSTSEFGRKLTAAESVVAEPETPELGLRR